MLDKSKGLVLGSELVTNGDFSGGTTGWTLGAGWAVTGGAAVFSNGTTAADLVSVVGLPVIGKTYRVTVTQAWTSGGQARAIYGGVFFDIPAASGTYTFFMTASASAEDKFRFRALVGASVFSLDNISVKELPGNHAVQATTANRPIYGIHPFGGRRNLLVRTEQFDNAAWVPITSGPSITRSAAEITFPATTTSGSVAVVRQAFTSLVSNYTGSVELKAKAAGDVGKRVGVWLNDGSVVNFTWHTLTSDWVRVTLTESMSAASSFMTIGVLGDTAVGGVIQGAVTVEIRNAQLETGSTATAYQRVTDQYNVTEAGVPSVSYLFFDGVNDSMATSTITPGVDKAQVFAGVRKLSDAAIGVIVELSNGSANGALYIAGPRNPATADYAFSSKGTIEANPVSSALYPAPITNVLTGLGDISGDRATLRVNATQVAQSTGDQGTGNYLAYPLYIGARAGTSLFFSGHLYSLIVRFGPNLATGQISSTETWVAGKTGITI
jgi:hypothetical protein